MAGVSMKRLGTVELGVIEEGEVSYENVDPAPLVLWSGNHPATVLTFQAKSSLVRLVGSQSFRLVEEGLAENLRGLTGPFPITRHFTQKWGEKESALDFIDTNQVYSADLDGDGMDELVLFTLRGGVEVHSPRKTLFEEHLPANKVVSYKPEVVHRARAGGRDVLFAVFSRDVNEEDEEIEREKKKARDNEDDEDEESAAVRLAKAVAARLAKAGAPDRSIVLRLDGHGATRLRLGDVARDNEILAVGAVNRPGSQVIDEVLVVSARKGEAFLSRHKLDGTPIDAPRKIYVPFPAIAPIRFLFVPQSKRAVVFRMGDSGVYFIEADKPVNWIKFVDLDPVEKKENSLTFFTAVDGASDPKVIFGNPPTLYAVNQEGTYFTWNGQFVPSTKMEPFLEISPPADVLLQDNGGEEFLAVRSNKYERRTPTFEEALAAAERFLPPEAASELKVRLDLNLNFLKYKNDSFREDLEEEAKKKGIKELPKTTEEWKTILPDSYAETVAFKHRNFTRQVMAEMDRILAGESQPTPSVNKDEIRAWIARLETPAETMFTLYRRGAKIGSFQVPGFLDRVGQRSLGNEVVAFRVQGKSVTAILPLKAKGGLTSKEEHAGLFLVQWNGGAN